MHKKCIKIKFIFDCFIQFTAMQLQQWNSERLILIVTLPPEMIRMDTFWDFDLQHSTTTSTKHWFLIKNKMLQKILNRSTGFKIMKR